MPCAVTVRFYDGVAAHKLFVRYAEYLRRLHDSHIAVVLFRNGVVRAVVYLLRLCLLQLLGSYEALFVHKVQNEVAPLTAFVGVFVGSVDVRRFYHACQHGAFRQRKLRRALVEIDVGGALYAVGVSAEIYGVEIHLQNFVLGIAFFQLQSQQCLVDLAFEVFAAVQMCVFDKLLTDGGGALGKASSF